MPAGLGQDVRQCSSPGIWYVVADDLSLAQLDSRFAVAGSNAWHIAASAIGTLSLTGSIELTTAVTVLVLVPLSLTGPAEPDSPQVAEVVTVRWLARA